MRTALDSSVLLLLSRKQPGWEAWRDALQAAASEGELLISPIAFAEFSIAYPQVEAAQADLDLLHIRGGDRRRIRRSVTRWGSRRWIRWGA